MFQNFFNDIFAYIYFLLQYKVNNSEIGIIAPYRKQVELIESKLKELSLHNIEINTVDQYQGRDKDVIIISCARPGNSPIKSEKVCFCLKLVINNLGFMCTTDYIMYFCYGKIINNVMSLFNFQTRLFLM